MITANTEKSIESKRRKASITQASSSTPTTSTNSALAEYNKLHAKIKKNDSANTSANNSGDESNHSSASNTAKKSLQHVTSTSALETKAVTPIKKMMHRAQSDVIEATAALRNSLQGGSTTEKSQSRYDSSGSKDVPEEKIIRKLKAANTTKGYFLYILCSFQSRIF